jgi:chromosomal replication initiation ATPase DnaA
MTMTRKTTSKLPPIGSIIKLPSPIDTFAENIARKYFVSVDDLLRVYGSRRQSICRARHELWVVTMDTFDLSYPDTGYLFGVDPSSVRAAREEYESRAHRA